MASTTPKGGAPDVADQDGGGNNNANNNPPETGQNPPAQPPNPTSGNLPAKPGDTSGTTPPAKPTEDGGANKGQTSQRKPSVFEGVDPKLIGAIKKALVDEVKTSVQAQLEQEQAQKEGKWEELYTKAKPKLDRLEAVESELETYKALVQKTLDDRIKDWPKEWLAGDPRKLNPDATLEVVMAWMDWAEPLVKAQTGTGDGGNKKPPTNVNAGAPGNGAASGNGGGTTGGGGGGGQGPRGGQPNASDVPAGWTKEDWERYKASRKSNYGLSV